MLRLLGLDDDRLVELERDPQGGLGALASNGAQAASFLAPLLGHSLVFHKSAQLHDPWFGYLALTQEPVQVVGICSFKGAPNESGEVEISYCTIDRFEGRGYATGMARMLMEIAFAAPEVRKVIAHTLPFPHASTSVLQKAGLECQGEVQDPEDGRIWRWEKCRGE